MTYKVALDNGHFCYTPNCKLHSDKWSPLTEPVPPQQKLEEVQKKLNELWQWLSPELANEQQRIIKRFLKTITRKGLIYRLPRNETAKRLGYVALPAEGTEYELGFYADEGGWTHIFHDDEIKLKTDALIHTYLFDKHGDAIAYCSFTIGGEYNGHNAPPLIFQIEVKPELRGNQLGSKIKQYINNYLTTELHSTGEKTAKGKRSITPSPMWLEEEGIAKIKEIPINRDEVFVYDWDCLDH